jgi:hypothetical protein
VVDNLSMTRRPLRRAALLALCAGLLPAPARAAEPPPLRWRHHAVPAGYTGPALASAYDVVGGDGTGITVATVQFSGWHAADLDTYAAAAGLPDPDPIQIAVNGADPTLPDGAGGDFEVALDQQILLAAAPNAGQRIYFTPNTGFDDAIAAYDAVADDAENGLVDVVSVSWGMCEVFADQDPTGRAAMEAQLARIVTAGATIFAASGDLGAYDCGDEVADPAVDYPAASPYVVGVGGTTLRRLGSAWHETAWRDDTQGTASGGGASSSVPRPSYQTGLAIGGTTRLVPDVAALADPRSGFGVYAGAHGGWTVAGGTSAGAPLLAGHLAAALSAAGRTSGIGSIHEEFYASPHAFRDVTSGGNFLYAATSGYDRATGLGTPLWGRLAGALLGGPVVSAPETTRSTTVPLVVTPPAGVTVTGWAAGEGSTVACGTGPLPDSVTLAPGDRVTRVAVAALGADEVCRVGTTRVVLDTRKPVATAGVEPVRHDARTVFAWGSSDPSPSSGVTYDVCVYRLGTGCVLTLNDTPSRSLTLTLSPGRTYVLRVTPTDLAGNAGARLSTARYTVPVDQTAFGRTVGWSGVGSSADWYGSHWSSSTVGSYLAKVLAGTRYELLYVAHPLGGVVDVYVSGVLVKRVNTYSATTTYRKVAVVAAYPTRASRAVRLVVRSGRVAVDAVRVAY